jgi:hypothetical protein
VLEKERIGDLPVIRSGQKLVEQLDGLAMRIAFEEVGPAAVEQRVGGVDVPAAVQLTHKQRPVQPIPRVLWVGHVWRESGVGRRNHRLLRAIPVARRRLAQQSPEQYRRDQDARPSERRENCGDSHGTSRVGE